MSLSDVAAMKAAVGIIADDYGAVTTNGTGIDTRGYHQALVILNVGTVTTSLDVKVQESSDDDTADSYADISGAAFTQVTTANDNAIYVARINLTGTERYIRIVASRLMRPTATMLSAAARICVNAAPEMSAKESPDPLSEDSCTFTSRVVAMSPAETTTRAWW